MNPLNSRGSSISADVTSVWLVDGPQEAVGGPVADLDAVGDPGRDRLAEVEPDEDAGEPVLVGGLGEAGVVPQDGRGIGAGLPGGQRVAAGREADVVGTEELFQDLCRRATFDAMSRVVVRNRWCRRQWGP